MTMFQRKYQEAYCPELKRLVTCSEIWDLVVGPHRVPQTLSFQCPDPDCRIPLLPSRMYSYGRPQEVLLNAHRNVGHKPKCGYHNRGDKRKNEIKALEQKLLSRKAKKSRSCALPSDLGASLSEDLQHRLQDLVLTYFRTSAA